MTWGEIQIESLEKMFLNNTELNIEDLDEYKENKKYNTYLFAMPQACNEAIDYITVRLGAEEQLKHLDVTGNGYYNLKEEFEDYKKIKKVLCPSGTKWKMISDSIIQIENENDNINILYEPVATVISSDSQPTTTINLKNEYVRLIPLYIAGELYKDDDVTLSTIYMNEFMTMINAYVDNQTSISNPSIETIYCIE